MLRSLKDLEHYKVHAVDGDIGSVVRFLLDDEHWIVRYLVVQTGGPLFLDGRRVLISPVFFRQAEWSTQRFHLALTMEKVKNSPGIDIDEPVSRQHERDYSRYYGYPCYWTLAHGALPEQSVGAARDAYDAARGGQVEQLGDVHLRSDQEVRGYHIQGSDEAIGHVEDFIVDDQTWEVRYLVIDTSNWWFGKKVLVAPQWASRISWKEDKVYLDLSREAIKNSPEWNAAAAINREYESRLYDYYGRPAYWDSGDRVVGVPPPEARPMDERAKAEGAAH